MCAAEIPEPFLKLRSIHQFKTCGQERRNEGVFLNPRSEIRCSGQHRFRCVHFTAQHAQQRPNIIMSYKTARLVCFHRAENLYASHSALGRYYVTSVVAGARSQDHLIITPS